MTDKPLAHLLTDVVAASEASIRLAEVSSRNPLPFTRETACEHLRNAAQQARALADLLTDKGLIALASDVDAISDRIQRARAEIAEGNLGK
jgi:adenylylsulfate kinase-like enzyme